MIVFLEIDNLLNGLDMRLKKWRSKMNIWIAALCSLGILGAIAILLALSICFMEWVVDNDHMEACLLVAIIAFWILLTIGIYAEGGVA